MASDPTQPQPAPADETDLVFRQLCHLLSLDRNGKIQSAIESLITTVLFLDPKVGASADPREVAGAVAAYFEVKVDVSSVQAGIESHLQAGTLLIDTPAGPPRIVLSAEAKADVAARIDDAKQLEDRVRADWIKQTSDITPGTDPKALWQVLRGYLGLVFRQHGAAAVYLLDATAHSGEGGEALSSLLDQAIQRAGTAVGQAIARQAVSAFFHSDDPTRLRYISELLDGTFTFFALTVADSVADYLRDQLPPLRLFLDTNVILGLLELQGNPLQAQCDDLLAMIEDGGFLFQLYYHERTAREINEIGKAAREKLGSQHYTPQLSQAYIEWAERHSGTFGVDVQFHRLNAAHEIDLEAFLARFNHIQALLESKNIRLYRQSGPEPDASARDLYLATFKDFALQRRRKRGPEALDHDVTLWMYLQQLRAPSKNALHTRALLLSMDNVLHSFDQAFLMKQHDGLDVPTVVLPHQMIQVLRPLCPGTSDYNEKFLAVFAAAEFRSAQSGYEATASKVIKYLASFDGVPKETAISILNDDLLMRRLYETDSQSTEFARLIDETVLKESDALLTDMDSMRQRLSEVELALSQSVESARAEIASLKVQLTDVTDARSQLERDLHQARTDREEADAKAREAEAAQRTLARRVRLGASILTAIVGVLTIVGAPSWMGWRTFLALPRHGAAQGLLVLAWLGVSYASGPFRQRMLVAVGVTVAALIAAMTLL